MRSYPMYFGLFLSVLFITLLKVNGNETDSLSLKDLIKAGEKLYTSPDTALKAKACISCHALTQPDTFNWNPTLQEIEPFMRTASFEELQELILYPYQTNKLMEVHSNYDFSDEELNAIRTFILNYKNKNHKNPEGISSKQLVLLSSVIIFLLVLFDYLKTRKIKHSFIHLLLLISCSIVFMNVLIKSTQKIKLQEGYKPTQPIKFSHKQHSEVNNIDCRYCHSEAYNSKTGGIPSVQTCHTCHLVTREGSMSGGFELRKLIAAWEQKKTIEWVKVNNLPDHVRFHHGIHVTQGGISCETCHGDVKQMDIVFQPKGFTMNFCLDCHKSSNIEFPVGSKDSVPFHKSGGWDCITCHK